MLCPICKSKATFTKQGRLLCSSSVCETNTGVKPQKQPKSTSKPFKAIKTKGSEHSLQYQVIELLRANGIMAISTDVMSGLAYFSQTDHRRFAFINHHKKMGYIVGQSDLIVVMPDTIAFAELKKDKGKQSIEQIAFQKIVEKLGYEYTIWRSLDDVKDWMGM